MKISDCAKEAAYYLQVGLGFSLVSDRRVAFMRLH